MISVVYAVVVCLSVCQGTHKPVSGGAQHRAGKFCFTEVPKIKTVGCSRQYVKEEFQPNFTLLIKC